jgi:hypothetical protein
MNCTLKNSRLWKDHGKVTNHEISRVVKSRERVGEMSREMKARMHSVRETEQECVLFSVASES